MLKANPAHDCDLPPVPQHEAKVLDYGGALQLIESSADHPLTELLMLDVACGARRGELLALSWSDVDFRTAMLTIARSLEQTKARGLRPKETKGRRIRRVKLPGDTIQALLNLRKRQAETRRLFGPDYRTDLNLIFCAPDGNFLRPCAITKIVRRLAKKAGFADVSLHTLRHSHGSQLLSKGVPLPPVSKRLGHASVGVTANVYAHALPADEIAAAEIWEQAMQKAAKEPRHDPRVIPMPAKPKSA